jgi:hypothetical protein
LLPPKPTSLLKTSFLSSSSQTLLDTNLPVEIGLKELKIMQLKKKKVRVSASTDLPHHHAGENTGESGSAVFKSSIATKANE